MGANVKTSFPRRQERARRTRAAVIDAARELFVAGGYGATTIADIAEMAGVAVQTVYAVFGTKRAILAEVVDRSIAGDDAPVAVNALEWMQPVWNAPTAELRLRAYASAVRRIMDSAGDVLTTVSSAASVDADVADLHATTEQRRRSGATAVVDSVRAAGRLRPELTREQAIDVLWLLNGPAVFQHLVRSAGWSLARYERWLAGTLVRELLAEG